MPFLWIGRFNILKIGVLPKLVCTFNPVFFIRVNFLTNML